MMWTETDAKSQCVTKAVTLDSLGNKTSEIVTKDVQLSDCQPELCSDGRVRWFASDGTVTKFYSIDPFRFADDERVILGDANGDGMVDIRDVTAIQRHASEYQNVKSFKAADVDGDKAVAVQDATLIQRYLAEYKVEYTIGAACGNSYSDDEYARIWFLVCDPELDGQFRKTFEQSISFAK